MIQFTLEGHAEKIAPPHLYPPQFQGQELLYHQARTWAALKDCAAVLNTYNTGTGKTQASLLHLFDVQAKAVLVIAPTNALIEQHTADIRDFVDKQGLDFTVLPARAQEISNMRGDLRRGEALQRFIKNYQEFETLYQQHKPLIMVTNPDIFYYALFFRYGAHDRRNVFNEFVGRFDYLIIDEFHYYDNKQLVCFLFALMLFKQFGFLEKGRRICMLSATPRPNVMKYLQGLLGDQLAAVSPHNEPAEAASYETKPALTPLHLTIQPESLSAWVDDNYQVLHQWLDAGQDGVIISNSLARINEAYGKLRFQYQDDNRLGRITGPEPQSARTAATARQLILATPTVDIGYNFDKSAKDRQYIDFVVCEARYQDDLVQRIGRAGRILRANNQREPSHAVVLLTQDAYQEFNELAGQTLSRSAFAAWLSQREHLNAKYQLEAYLREYALKELAYPLYQFGQTLMEEDQNELDSIYDQMAALLEAPRPPSRRSLAQTFKTQERRDRWLQAAKSAKIAPAGTAEYLAEYLAFREPDQQYDPKGLPDDFIAKVWQQADHREGIVRFAKSQQALDGAIFRFRDSFQGPTAVVYDPAGFFSSQAIGSYDIFHFLRNYQFTLLNQVTLQRLVPDDPVPEGDFYLRLDSPLDKPLRLSFTLTVPMLRDDFAKWTRYPSALQGYGLELDQGIIPILLSQHFSQAPVVGMILPPEDARIVRSRFWGTELMAWSLRVNFADGTFVREYLFFAGTAAFVAHAELKGYFHRKDRQQSDAIIT